MCNISTFMYHVIQDDHLEIKLIVLYLIVYIMSIEGFSLLTLRSEDFIIDKLL